MRHLGLDFIERLQQQKLLRLLRYTKKRSPFYAKLYKELDIFNELQMRDIPLVDKQILMDNFDQVLTVRDVTKQKTLDFIKNEKKHRQLNKKYTPIHSGGTSGTLWISLFDESCFDYEIASIIEDPSLNLLSRFFKKPLRIAAATSEHIHVGSSVFYSNLPKFLANLRHFSVRRPIADIVKELNDFDPNVLGGYPLMLGALAEQKLKGRLTVSPKKVFSVSAPLSKDNKEVIAHAFNCIPYDNYYATESTAAIATECPYHCRHVLANSVVVEVLDSDDQPAAPGKPGKIVITNLMNFTQPIIRYRLKDVVQISKRKCKCGASLPIIEKVWGRTGDVLWIKRPDGDYEVIDPILFNLKVPGLAKLQVIQEANDFLRIKVVVSDQEEEVLKQVKQAVVDILKEKAINQIVRIKIEVVSDILAETKGEKLLPGYHKLVISKV